MSCYKFDQVKNAVLSKEYKWFEDGEYNLNIVGVRNSSTGTRVTNQFDDCITVSFKTKRHGQQFFCYPANVRH